MNPAVIVWDTAASVLLVVVEVGRQDHRFGWWLWPGASHADSVAGVSSDPACVADRTSHEQPPGEVEERQAASLGLGSHHSDDLVDPLGLAALVAAPGVHLCCLCAARARWRRLDADAFQELRQLSAGAVGWRRWLYRRCCLAWEHWALQRARQTAEHAQVIAG
jgi:hypothetical protein